MKPETENSYQGMPVLIFGVSGFIGTHLSNALDRLGASVIGAGRSSHGDSSESKRQSRVRYISCDVTDPKQVHDAIAATKPDLVFNLAARIGGGATADEAEPQMRVSANGVTNIAKEILAQQPRALLVQLGSSEEYGNGPAPFLESSNDRPISPYSAAKVAATRFLVTAHEKANLNAIVVRPSVVFGPGQDSQMFIPFVLKHYLSNKVPDLTKGEQKRDFLYIDDLIAGLLKIAERADLSGEIFNLASGNSLVLSDVARKAAELCNYQGELGLGKRPYRQVEVMEHCLSRQKAADLLGWAPKIDFDDGLRRTVNWWQSKVG